MSTKIEELKKISLDGQILYIIPPHLFSQIYEDPYIEGIRLMKHSSLDYIVKENMEFIYNHKDIFEFSIFQLPNMGGWFYNILLKQNNELIRVYITKMNCPFCGCNYYLADHMLSSEIFLGLDLKTQKKLLNKYPVFGKTCPSCGAMIDRPSIWTEVIL